VNEKQMNLAELTFDIEYALNKGQGHIPVVFELSDVVPMDFLSWRGDYSQIAISYGISTPNNTMTASKFLYMLRSIEETPYFGFKGGEYFFNNETPVWVDNWGEDTNTALVGVMNLGSKILLETRFLEKNKFPHWELVENYA